MRQLLVAFVATAALVAFQNPAEAVFEKVIIDEFTQPATASHSGMAGNPNAWSTRASGGTLTDGSPQNPNPRTLTSGTDVASDRGLSAASPPDIVAGGGSLTLSLPEAGDRVGIDWDVDGYDFTNELNVGLVGLVNSLVQPATLLVSMYQYQGGVANLVESKSVTLVSGADPTSLFFTALPGVTDYLGFEFQLTSGTNFIGEVDSVVANPEPATMALMGLGVLGGAIGYRRRRKDDEVVPAEA